MLREFLEFLFTPASREARKLGYLYETIALKQRFRRRQAEWRSHIEKCRTNTLRALGESKTILILGSGPLLEIPILELTERCDKVTLIDFVHPRGVRNKWGKHAKVTLIEEDLLGIAAKLLESPDGPLPPPNPPDLKKYGADFILSANCLSQLPLKPRQFLEKAGRLDNLDLYCEQLSAAHLRSIKSTGSKHLLITDFETKVYENGSLAERTEPFFDRGSLRMMDSWNWRLAPPGELSRRRTIEMTAGAFTIL